MPAGSTARSRSPSSALKDAGLIRRAKDGVRLLGHGELKAKLAFEVTGASASAIKAVEAVGGTVTLKSITGREAPPADEIKAEKRAASATRSRRPKAKKSGKAPKAEGEQAAEAEGEAKAAKPAKAKAEAAAEAAAKAPRKPRPTRPRPRSRRPSRKLTRRTSPRSLP